MRRPLARPLTASECQWLAREARAFADELTADYALRVQRTLADTADDRYPSKTSGAGQQAGGGGELTVVEMKAMGRDRAAVDAETVMSRQRTLLALIPAVTQALRGVRPDRPVEVWPCGHLKAGDNRGSRRCLECGSGATRPICETCGEEVTAGGQRRKSVAYDQGGVSVMECDRCWQWRRRTGGLTRKGPAADVVALRSGLVQAGEAYNA